MELNDAMKGRDLQEDAAFVTAASGLLTLVTIRQPAGARLEGQELHGNAVRHGFWMVLDHEWPCLFLLTFLSFPMCS